MNWIPIDFVPQVKSFRHSGDPVISVDTKKKELVGAFKMAGRK